MLEEDEAVIPCPAPSIVISENTNPPSRENSSANSPFNILKYSTFQHCRPHYLCTPLKGGAELFMRNHSAIILESILYSIYNSLQGYSATGLRWALWNRYLIALVIGAMGMAYVMSFSGI